MSAPTKGPTTASGEATCKTPASQLADGAAVTAGVLVPDQVIGVALEAAWELDALAELMLSRVAARGCFSTPEEKTEAMCSRALLLRIRDLTSVLMSVVSDDFDDAARLEKRVFGRFTSPRRPDDPASLARLSAVEGGAA